MKVLRFQDKNGSGPYSHIPHIFVDGAYWNPPVFQPAPWNDRGIDRYPDPAEQCGFKDIFQAYKWFKQDDVCTMLEHKIELVEVEAEYVVVGECQVLFKKKE